MYRYIYIHTVYIYIIFWPVLIPTITIKMAAPVCSARAHVVCSPPNSKEEGAFMTGYCMFQMHALKSATLKWTTPKFVVGDSAAWMTVYNIAVVVPFLYLVALSSILHGIVYIVWQQFGKHSQSDPITCRPQCTLTTNLRPVDRLWECIDRRRTEILLHLRPSWMSKSRAKRKKWGHLWNIFEFKTCQNPVHPFQ